MKLSHIGPVLALSLATMLPAKGALVISEVLFNEVSSDTTGEWIEIFNNGGLSIDLSNYKIGDEETSGGTGATEHMASFSAGMSIAPGEVQIIAVSATRFFDVYGFKPTYEVLSTDSGVPDLGTYSTWDPDGGAINMSNSNDQMLILDENDSLVDAVNWGNTFFMNPGLGTAADGQSYQRINPYVDTDSASDWELGPGTEVAAALRSTPGVVPVPEPSTWAMMLMGIGGAAVMIRRRK